MSPQRVPRIFAPVRRDRRAARAQTRAGTTDAATWLHDELCRDVIERLEFMRFEPARALAIGPSAPQLEALLVQRGSDVTGFAAIDEELPQPGAPYDLIVSHGRLDTVNDLPGALLHLRHALGPGGLMIAQFPGAGSLATLRQIMLAADGERPAARIHPQIDDRAATALLQRAGFSKQVVDTHRMTVRYRSFHRLIADLRDQALSSVLLSHAPYVGKAGIARAQAAFEAMADQDGKVNETFEILTLTAWR